MPVLTPINGNVHTIVGDAPTPPVLAVAPRSRQNIEVGMHDSVAEAVSPFTGSQQEYEWIGAKWWTLTCTCPPQKADKARAWVAFLAALRGKAGAFVAGDSSLRHPRGKRLGVPLVDGANQKGFVLATKGWTPSTLGQLLKGDYIQLSIVLPRLYMVVEDVNSDADGKAAVKIWPNLRETPANDATVILDETVGTFRLTSNARSFTVDEALIYGVKFEGKEYL